MPRITVIIPIYNVEKYIERCANSLFEQTLSDLEYIFVDDCSSDNSLELLSDIISCYPNRKNQIKIIKHLENKGAAVARSNGLKIATGDYIAYCDSDDWVANNTYELLLEKAEQTNADIVYCNFNMVYYDKILEYDNLQLINDKKDFLRTYMTTGWTSLCNLISRRNLYVDNNLDFSDKFSYCEDFYLSVKLMFFSEKIEKVNKYLYYYNRENESSLLHNNKTKAREDELICYNEMIDFFKSQGCLDDYIKELSWKILRCKQDWVLCVDKHKRFMETNQETHKYILSCPFINVKIKILMWMLVHKMSVLVKGLLYMRKSA